MNTLGVKEYRKDLDDGSILIVHVRYNDECKNGHNTFAITAHHYDRNRANGDPFRIHAKTNDKKYLGSCGCQHDLVIKHFPELRNYIKWHLTSTDGPMHYFDNTMYWAEQGNLEHARMSAVWPDATLEQLADRKALEERLPGLMSEFQKDIEALGFTY
jgi:hypothetical protein